MRKLGGLIAIIVFLLLTHQISVNSQINDAAPLPNFDSNKLEPIRFWSVDTSDLQIIETHIFPALSLSSTGGFSGFGDMYIAWTIQVGDSLIPGWAIYSKGKIVKSEILQRSFNSIHWSGVLGDLFLVGSSGSETTLLWFSPDRATLAFSMNFQSSGQQLYLTQDEMEIFLLQNNTIPTNVVISASDVEVVEANETLFHSFPGLGGLYVNKTNNVNLRTKDGIIPLSSNFTTSSYLGHLLLEPAVFDVSTKQLWTADLNKTISLPQDILRVHPFGLRSSVIETKSGLLQEYYQGEWITIASIPANYDISSFSIVDFDLYIATTNFDGISLFMFGPDSDNDFLPNTAEDYFLSDINNNDTDNDGITDSYEVALGTDPSVDDRLFDVDGDGLTNIDELNMGLKPALKDSDYGGAYDGWELKYGLNPLDKSDDALDYDGDGLINADESKYSTNPNNTDTDGDSMPDDWEVKYNLDPLNSQNRNEDNDGDGFSNYEEYKRGTDPFIPDEKEFLQGLAIWLVPIGVLYIPAVYYLWRFINSEEEVAEEANEEDLNSA